MGNSRIIKRIISGFFIGIMVLFIIMLLPACNINNSVSYTATITSTSTITPSPTITSKPSLTRWPTKTPSITATPTPVNFGWPIMEQEDYTITKQNNFYHYITFGYKPLISDYDTQILLDYGDNNIVNESLNRFLLHLYPNSEFSPYVYEDGTMAVLSSHHGKTIYLNYGFGEYVYDVSTSAELCQFFESATLEGYGLAKEPGESVFSAFVVLISEFGDSGNIDDPFLFYCSNLDRESENFLLIAKA